MSIINVKLDSPILRCDFSFDRRLSILTGDSGIGKTTLVELLQERPNSVQIESTYPVIVANSSGWREILKGASNNIIIFDDLIALETEDFARMYAECVVKNNNYVIAINRTSQFSSTETNSKLAVLSFSINSVYTVFNENGTLRLESKYKQPKVELNNVDCCIVEDSGQGFQFFEKWMKCEIVSAESGKSAIVSALLDLSDNYTNVLILFDSAAFGCHMEDLINVMTYRRPNVCYYVDYECFEELLVQSNFFKKNSILQKELENISDYANRYISWERYFEDLLERLTATTNHPYKHGGKNLHPCYKQECYDCISQIEAKCADKTSISKIIYMLQNTKYERFLQIMSNVTSDAENVSNDLQKLDTFS